jgi:hypothetical protein
MSRRPRRAKTGGMDKTPTPRTTTAFFVQSALAFGIALLAVVLGICYLPVDTWMRSFLAVGTLFLVSSSFTLAKVVRDAQEQSTIITRVDQARVERLLAEHDPFTAV